MDDKKKLSELIYGALSDEERDGLLDLEDEFTLWKETRTELLKNIVGKKDEDDSEKPKK